MRLIQLHALAYLEGTWIFHPISKPRNFVRMLCDYFIALQMMVFSSTGLVQVKRILLIVWCVHWRWSKLAIQGFCVFLIIFRRPPEIAKPSSTGWLVGIHSRRRSVWRLRRVPSPKKQTSWGPTLLTPLAGSIPGRSRSFLWNNTTSAYLQIFCSRTSAGISHMTTAKNKGHLEFWGLPMTQQQEMWEHSVQLGKKPNFAFA